VLDLDQLSSAGRSATDHDLFRPTRGAGGPEAQEATAGRLIATGALIAMRGAPS
jgi:hypothetical protein